MAVVDGTWFASRRLTFEPTEDYSYSISLERTLLKTASSFDVVLPPTDMDLGAGAVATSINGRVRRLVEFEAAHTKSQLRWVGSFDDVSACGDMTVQPFVFVLGESGISPARKIAFGPVCRLNSVDEQDHPPIEWVPELRFGIPWEIQMGDDVKIRLNKSFEGLADVLSSRATSGRPFIAKALVIRNIVRDFDVLMWQQHLQAIIEHLDGDDDAFVSLSPISRSWALRLLDWIETLEETERSDVIESLRNDDHELGLNPVSSLLAYSDAVANASEERHLIRAIAAATRDSGSE